MRVYNTCKNLNLFPRIRAIYSKFWQASAVVAFVLLAETATNIYLLMNAVGEFNIIYPCHILAESLSLSAVQHPSKEHCTYSDTRIGFKNDAKLTLRLISMFDDIRSKYE